MCRIKIYNTIYNRNRIYMTKIQSLVSGRIDIAHGILWN